MEVTRGINLREPHVESTKIMAYIERHKLFEVFRRLAVEATFKRPADMKRFMRDNIKGIAAQVYPQKLCLLTPSFFDNEQLAHVFWKSYNIPVIVYTKQRNGCDGDVILKKFRKFLKAHKLERKNLIFFNFPDCRVECGQFRAARMDPTAVVEVVPTFQFPFKTRKMQEDEAARYLWQFEQVESFYREVFHRMYFGPTNGVDKNGDRCKRTFQDLCNELIEIMRHRDVRVEENAWGSFSPRILILGRKGSGRKTHARALAKHYNLVYIDFKNLLLEYAKSTCPIGDALRNGIKTHEYSDCLIATIFYKRILEKDCLLSGWVAVDYPHNVQDFKNMEKFIVQANKIIFLHCRENVTYRRLEKMLEKHFNKLPCQACSPELCKENIEAIEDMKAAIQDEVHKTLSFSSTN